MAELGKLKPIACIDHEGKKHNLLAAPEVIQNVMASQEKNPLSSFSIVPQKRKKLTEDYLPEVPFPSIRNIILNSQCKSLLFKSNYIEIDHQIAFWLNCSWTLYPKHGPNLRQIAGRDDFRRENQIFDYPWWRNIFKTAIPRCSLRENIISKERKHSAILFTSH